MTSRIVSLIAGMTIFVVRLSRERPDFFNRDARGAQINQHNADFNQRSRPSNDGIAETSCLYPPKLSLDLSVPRAPDSRFEFNQSNHHIERSYRTGSQRLDRNLGSGPAAFHS